MNSLLLLLLSIVVVVLGYIVYSKRIDKNVIKSDPNKATPAKMYMDGVDFTPTSKNVLFGYQFKSIAALGPIVGVIVALQWGWLPALLWLLIGVLFIGWVQDYTSTMISIRNDGQTFGGLSYTLISPRARTILLAFIYFYILLILGAFGSIVTNVLLNVKTPLGIIMMTLAGVLAGQMIYKWHVNIIATTVITVVLSFLGIWLGTLPAISGIFEAINGGADSPKLFGSITQAHIIWTLVVFFFCYLGAVLPIWRWAQPVNYVSFWIVGLGMLGAVIGIVILRPSLSDFPVVTTNNVPGLGPIWPILFVTIACGAVSGWHSLVSSSGTARQLEKESEALSVTGGVMFAETLLAVIALITGIVAYGVFNSGMDGYSAVLKGQSTDLVNVKEFGTGPMAVFAVGISELLNSFGLGKDFGLAFGAVFLIIMAITVMQLCLRFMRVASAEFLGEKIPIMRNIHIGSLVGVILSVFLVWTGYWQFIWVLFGGSNQLMASLALMIVSLWLIKAGKVHQWVSYPAIFMYITTIAALGYTSFTAFSKIASGQLPSDRIIGSAVAGVIAIFLIIAALILAYDGISAIIKVRRSRSQAAESPAEL
ncbi:MAG: carbon starvation protein [Candidatus Poribacteria bacterium]|nr:carbon starvation protein [Candidatus Poribacteria bacterium]